MRVIEIGNSWKGFIILSVVHRIVLKNSVESCGSDEVLPLIAGLLLESPSIFTVLSTVTNLLQFHGTHTEEW